MGIPILVRRFLYIETAPWSFLHLVLKGICRLTLEWRHNGRDGVSNHQPAIVYSTVYSSVNQRKKTSKLPVTGLCVGNSPVTGEFPAQMASNAEKVSIGWRHLAVCNKHWSVNSTEQISHWGSEKNGHFADDIFKCISWMNHYLNSIFI